MILDLSHWNKITNWDKIKSPLILKCTESTDYLDPTFKERQKISRQKGLYLGSYHFFRDVNVDKQVEWYLKNADFKEGEMMVLDFEINCDKVVEKCTRFINQLPTKWLYTNDARACNYSFPKDWNFWIARYGNNTGEKDKEPYFENWKMWQYTSVGRVDGIVGDVDLNEIKTPPSSNSEPTVALYNQKDPRWKDIVIGRSGKRTFTIGSDGCFICSLAMMVGKTPDEVFILLRKGGAITDGGMMISDKAAKVLGLSFKGKETDINKAPTWSPSIKEVRFDKGWQQHFVTRIIKPDGRKAILDPWGGLERKINYYELKCGTPNWEKGGFSYRLYEKR